VAGAAAFSFARAWQWAPLGLRLGRLQLHNGDVNVNVNKNATINNQINRNNSAAKVSTNPTAGEWKHDPSHRKRCLP
jgi:hypothetical protein